MSIAIVTGAAGLIGSEAATYFAECGFDIVGVDNDMRSRFFGPEASTATNHLRLEKQLGRRYRRVDIDIRDEGVNKLFAELGSDVSLVIHTAAQPSHDWAAREPITDFTVNANGTLQLLEATRRHCPDAAFIFTSTNKVYGDSPNHLPLRELETRWELEPSHTYAEKGIREDLSIDQTLHSLFGASKAAADLLVQEYGRYFGLKTVCFRGGCLTGPAHSGTELHGFLSYLVKCAVSGRPYRVFGYKGKQVRDNIHSYDLIRCFHQYFLNPRPGEVYNIGGGRHSNVSMLEAIDLAQDLTGRPLEWEYSDENRRGDHIWWVSDCSKFREHYPEWKQVYDIPMILQEMVDQAGSDARSAA